MDLYMKKKISHQCEA